VTLVDKINGSACTFGVWIAADTIVYGGGGTAGLQQVRADGGAQKALTSIDSAHGETGHYPGPSCLKRAPWFSRRHSANCATYGWRP